MDFTDEQIISWVSGMLLPLFRISAMVMTMPVIGARMIPNRIKLIISVLITLIIYPFLKDAPAISLLSPQFILLILQQILVGVVIGFLFQLVFQAVVIAGEIISMQSGLSFTMLVDPATQATMPVLSHFYVTMVSLLFVSLNGHLLLFQLIVDSFNDFPIGTNLLSQDGLGSLIRTSSIIFINAILISLPTVVTLLLGNISLAVMTRAAPQLNIFTIGFPITLMLGFFLLLFSLSDVSQQFYQLTSQTVSAVNEALK